MSSLNIDAFDLKNLLNIDQNHGDPWHGSDPDWHGRQARFSDYFVGLRVAIYLLAGYQLQGHNTVEKILYRWAPPEENDTEAYIDFIEYNTGIDRHEKLSIFDPDNEMKPRRGATGVLFKLLKFMVRYETFAGYNLSDTDFENAVALYCHPKMDRPS